VVPNPKESLLPGLFARVRLTLGEPYEALLVPAGAVVRKDGKAFVYTVSDKSLVQIHEVKLGPQIGGLRAVREGLTRGQSVIVDSSGALKQDARVKARPLPAEQPKDAPERK
jgi:multidrug efflux pump subunit AcrA (membrane-fusion protein)